MKKINVKVVGVMFDNEVRYGGRNRQDIIKELMETQGTEVVLGAHYMERVNGQGEAVCLYEVKTNQIVGWISTKDSAEINKKNHAKYYRGTISYHGCYHIMAESISEKKAKEMLAA